MYKQRDSLLLQKGIIRNAEGYTQYTYTGASDSLKAMQYYFHRDHLGNVCAVWNATTDEVVQRTVYYSSGVPMAQSMGQSVQPIKYNAHEYIEAHRYDVYDYGFRGYYATIGRFTSIDPLCERTPWQSPYAYANNNWINQIDILGLAGVNLSVPRLNWVAVDNFGKVLGSDMKSSDRGVYLVDDDDWDGTYGSLLDYPLVGWQKPGVTYTVGGFYDFIAANLSGMFKAHIGYVAGLMPKMSTASDPSFSMDLRDIIGITDVANTINGDIRCNEIFWFGANEKMYFRFQRHQQGGLAYSYSQAVKRNSTRKLISKTAGKYLTIASIFIEGSDIMLSQSIKPSNVINLSTTALAAVAAVPIVATTAPITASIILTATVVYTIADIATSCITGKSIGTHIDELYGGAIYSW